MGLRSAGRLVPPERGPVALCPAVVVKASGLSEVAEGGNERRKETAYVRVWEGVKATKATGLGK